MRSTRAFHHRRPAPRREARRAKSSESPKSPGTPLRGEELAEYLIQSSVDGILAFDRQLQFTVWNPAMERISGINKTQILGKCACDVFPFLRETGEDRFMLDALEGKSTIGRNRAYRVPE